MKRTATLLVSLLAAPLFAGDAPAVVGRFAAGERYVEPMRDAPASVSRMFVRAVNGKSAVDGIDLPATGGGMIVMLVPIGRSGVRHQAMMKTPTGESLRSTERTSSDGNVQRFVVDASEGLGLTLAADTQEVIHVDRTDAASYHLSIPALPAESGMLVVAGEPESRLTMTTSVGPLSRHAGEPVTLHATLRDGDSPVSGATVVARLAAPGAGAGAPIALLDDGLHGDGAKDDGDYAASIAELPSADAGFWSVRYDADGTNGRGAQFARSAATAFMNERTSARLEARSIHSEVTAGVLHLRASADIVDPGAFRFDVIVATKSDGNGERRGIAWGEATRTLVSGANELAIDIPVGDVRADELFVDVRLLNLDTMGVAARVTR